MRPYARTPISALAMTLCALIVTAMVGSSAAVADAANSPASPPRTTTASSSATCPDHVTPPPPADTSEQPAPGQQAPGPLPEPASPVGGPQLGQCGDIVPSGAPAPPTGVEADSWLLEDLDTGAVLAAKDPHARERPASLIKLLLALVVTRTVDPTTMITATQDDANQEATRVGIVPGAQYSVSDLIDALLMKSGNDVAYALAMQLGGLSAAEQKMDALAAQLGALDTRAGTPSGLDGPGMSASAYDIGVIFRTAMTNQLISTAVQTKSLVLPASNGKPAVSVSNENELLVGGPATRPYPGEIGGKTGFTTDAQHTYVDAAEEDGHRVALVMMRNPQNLDGVYANAKGLLDYGFQLDEGKFPAVGQIVTANPLTAKTTTAAATSKNVQKSKTSTADAKAMAAARTPDDPISTFGTVGKPLTILAGLALLLIAVLVLRRKLARRRRAARTAAKAAASVQAAAVPVPAPARPSVPAEQPPAPAKDVNWDAVDEAFAQPPAPRPVRRAVRAPQRDRDGNSEAATEVFNRIK